MNRNWTAVYGCLLLASGCNEQTDSTPPAADRLKQASGGAKDAPSSAAVSKASAVLKGGGGYEVTAVPDAGAIVVTVAFKGDPIPVTSEVPVSVDAAFCGHKVFTENVIVDARTRGLKNVVVRLEGITKGKAPAPEVLIRNKGCAFDPHVSVAMKGAKIGIRSEDPVIHTTQTDLAGTSFFSVTLAPGSEPPPPRPIPRTGLMEITCEVHKWMHAFLYVHTNPYIGVSDAQGKLRIDGIPPGKHAYVAWHEQLGERRGEVEVMAGKATELRLELEVAR